MPCVSSSSKAHTEAGRGNRRRVQSAEYLGEAPIPKKTCESLRKAAWTAMRASDVLALFHARVMPVAAVCNDNTSLHPPDGGCAPHPKVHTHVYAQTPSHRTLTAAGTRKHQVLPLAGSHRSGRAAVPPPPRRTDHQALQGTMRSALQQHGSGALQGLAAAIGVPKPCRAALAALAPAPAGRPHRLKPALEHASTPAWGVQGQQQSLLRCQSHLGASTSAAASSAVAAVGGPAQLPPQLAVPQAPDQQCVVNFYILVDLEDPMQVGGWTPVRGSRCAAPGGPMWAYCRCTTPCRTAPQIAAAAPPRMNDPRCTSRAGAGGAPQAHRGAGPRPAGPHLHLVAGGERAVRRYGGARDCVRRVGQVAAGLPGAHARMHACV